MAMLYQSLEIYPAVSNEGQILRAADASPDSIEIKYIYSKGDSFSPGPGDNRSNKLPVSSFFDFTQ